MCAAVIAFRHRATTRPLAAGGTDLTLCTLISNADGRFMRRTLFASALSLLFFAAGVSALAQTAGVAANSGARSSSAQASPVARVNVPLPASDAVLRADLKKLLTEAVPHALAGDQAKLAQVNADV